MGCDRMRASGEEVLLGMIYKALMLDMNIIYKTLLGSRAATRLMLSLHLEAHASTKASLPTALSNAWLKKAVLTFWTGVSNFCKARTELNELSDTPIYLGWGCGPPSGARYFGFGRNL